MKYEHNHMWAIGGGGKARDDDDDEKRRREEDRQRTERNVRCPVVYTQTRRSG